MTKSILTPKYSPKQQQQIKKSAVLIIRAILNEQEPEWDSMPKFLLKDWRRAWDLTLKGF